MIAFDRGVPREFPYVVLNFKLSAFQVVEEHGKLCKVDGYFASEDACVLHIVEVHTVDGGDGGKKIAGCRVGEVARDVETNAKHRVQ